MNSAEMIKVLKAVITGRKQKSEILNMAHITPVSISGTEFNDEMVSYRINTGLKEMLVNSRQLLTILKALPKKITGEIFIESGNVSIGSKLVGVVDTINIEDLPVMEAVELVELTRIPCNILKSAALFMAKQDVRYYLNGVYINVEDEKIQATDGHRLFECELLHDIDGASIIINGDAIKLAVKLLKGNVLIQVAGGRVILSDSTKLINISADLVDGKYPEFKRIIKDELPDYTTFNVDQSLAALKALKPLVNNYKIVSLHTPGKFEVLSVAHDVECIGCSKAESIWLNIDYLIDVFKSLKDHKHEKATIGFSDEKGLIQIEEDGKKYLIMPLRKPKK